MWYNVTYVCYNVYEIKRGENMDKNNAIEVRNMSKRFKLQYDKPQTLKERLITSRNNKVEYHEVLKNISLVSPFLISKY